MVGVPRDEGNRHKKLTAWLERSRIATLPPGALPRESVLALRAYRFLGGLDWAGLDQVMDLLGLDDKELLVEQLVTIRDFKAKAHG
jgi:hypothetical protein